MRNDIDHLFLNILSKSIHNVSYEYTENKDTLFSLYGIASKHKVLPLIYDSIQISPQSSGEVIAEYDLISKKVRNQIFSQSQRTAEFMLLIQYLSEKGLYPIVMKGIICRNLYVNPEHRQSVDEDLLIEPSQFEIYHSVLLDYGFELADVQQNIDESYEVSYRHPQQYLYLEVHKSMFDPNSKSCGRLNYCFKNVYENSLDLDVYGLSVKTLCYTDHLLYLILHAFKHFLYSGFGVRLILDILLFSKAYEKNIDWFIIRDELSKVNALHFTCAVYKIGVNYLLPEFDALDILKDWPFNEVNESNLLEDVLDGGVFGTSDVSRSHSSIFTLQAVSNGLDEVDGSTVLGSVFPSAQYLRGRYTYLDSKPFLLPVAWSQRVIQYLSDNKHKKRNIKKPIEIGNKRVSLLKEYKIIP